jgi:hypothetical protein
MDTTDLFNEHKYSCPWHNEDGQCDGTELIHYNQHVNDKHISYQDCEERSCPVFHWVEVLISKSAILERSLDE